MKHLTKNTVVLIIILIASAITVSAQHHMNHSAKDSTKQMQHHIIKDSSKHMGHQMMMDSSKMNHMKMDTSKMHPKNMKHNKMKMDDAKQSMNMDKTIWNKVCPVKGGEVDTETPTVQYKGKTIGFCCPGCDSKFKEDPEKYLEKFNKDGSLKK